MFHLVLPSPLFRFRYRAPALAPLFRLPNQRRAEEQPANASCNPVFFIKIKFFYRGSPLSAKADSPRCGYAAMEG